MILIYTVFYLQRARFQRAAGFYEQISFHQIINSNVQSFVTTTIRLKFLLCLFIRSAPCENISVNFTLLLNTNMYIVIIFKSFIPLIQL